MNRRDFFKGLAITAAALSVKLPALEVYGRSPMLERLLDQNDFVKALRNNLLNRIIYPPCILHDDGQFEPMSTESDQAMLKWINDNFEEHS